MFSCLAQIPTHTRPHPPRLASACKSQSPFRWWAFVFILNSPPPPASVRSPPRSKTTSLRPLRQCFSLNHPNSNSAHPQHLTRRDQREISLLSPYSEAVLVDLLVSRLVPPSTSPAKLDPSSPPQPARLTVDAQIESEILTPCPCTRHSSLQQTLLPYCPVSAGQDSAD